VSLDMTNVLWRSIRRGAVVVMAAAVVVAAATLIFASDMAPGGSILTLPQQAPPLSIRTALFAVAKVTVLIGGSALLGRKVLRLHL